MSFGRTATTTATKAATTMMETTNVTAGTAATVASMRYNRLSGSLAAHRLNALRNPSQNATSPSRAEPGLRAKWSRAKSSIYSHCQRSHIPICVAPSPLPPPAPPSPPPPPPTPPAAGQLLQLLPLRRFPHAQEAQRSAMKTPETRLRCIIFYSTLSNMAN